MPRAPASAPDGEEPGRLSNDPRSRRLAGSATACAALLGDAVLPRSDRSSEPGGDAIIGLTTSSGSEIIKRLLYDEGYTIKGVQKLFKEQGVQALSAVALSPVAPPVEAAGSVEPHAGPQEDPGMRETYPGNLRTTPVRRCAKRWPKLWRHSEFLRKRARRRLEALC